MCAFAVVLLSTSAACHARPRQITESRTGAYEAALTRMDHGFAAAWYDTRDGNPEIYLRMLDADGQPAGPERRLTTGSDASYEVSIDRFGEAVAVAWYDQAGKSQPMVKLGVWGTDGTNHWVHALSSGTRNPVIRTDGHAIFCAWIQTEADGLEAVFAGWWEADGQPRAMPMRLGSASKTTWNLNAAVDSSGVPWVVFDAGATTRANELYVARADPSGMGAVRLTKDDGASSKYPDLAIAPDGRAALTWFDERDGNQEIYLLTGRLADLTGEIDGRSRRVTTTPGESIGAYIAWNGDRLGLAWSDKVGGQDEIFFQSFDASGTATGAPRRVTENVTWSLIPAIQPWRDGFALAWNEYSPASVEIHVGTSEIAFTTVP